ncbi:MAG: hypothetical protein EOP09_10605 [Proteobacteria bacterium]|nr:MAG: hypothetical protein EOP09_10605 [Pseudomonadota bacterium]
MKLLSPVNDLIVEHDPRVCVLKGFIDLLSIRRISPRMLAEKNIDLYAIVRSTGRVEYLPDLSPVPPDLVNQDSLSRLSAVALQLYDDVAVPCTTVKYI